MKMQLPRLEDCRSCGHTVPYEWVAPVMAGGKRLAGTGVWQSQLEDGLCPDCVRASEQRRRRAQENLLLRVKLVKLLGGPRPYREFRFESFKVTLGNRIAYEHCMRFDPTKENLYLWGPAGVGKTHLAYAVARRCVEESLTVEILPAYWLNRRRGIDDPDMQSAAVDAWTSGKVLIIDDLRESDRGCPESWQVLQDILDGRRQHDRSGLIVTSRYLPSSFAVQRAVEKIASRLAEMCTVLKVNGPYFPLNPAPFTVP
jgi:DNA replication protein DnaC